MVLVLVPTAPGRKPCLLHKRRDATCRRAISKPMRRRRSSRWWCPDGRRISDNHYAMRGPSAAGWSYFWYRAAFSESQRPACERQRDGDGPPGGAGPGACRLGHGGHLQVHARRRALRAVVPQPAPGGLDVRRRAGIDPRLQGTWRFTAGSAGMHQLTFGAGGRYERDLGSTAQVGVSERSSATATGGRFTLRDGELALTPEHRPQSPDRYQVRVMTSLFDRVEASRRLVRQPGEPAEHHRVLPGRTVTLTNHSACQHHLMEEPSDDLTRRPRPRAEWLVGGRAASLSSMRGWRT